MLRMHLGPYARAIALAACCFSIEAQIVQSAGQIPGDQNTKASRTITGTVVNSVTGEPIRRVLVQVNGQAHKSTFTGEDGHFQIEGLPEGQMFLAAQKPGFSNSDGPGFNSPTAVGPGITEIVLKLQPQAAIQGRIINAQGEPIGGVMVRVLAEQIVNGRKAWQPQQMTQSRQNGTFRIDNLSPGAYIVCTMTDPEFEFYNPARGDELSEEVYPGTYYPNAVDFASAQPLDVKPGEQAEADFTLTLVRAFKVSGIAGPARNGVSISVLDSGLDENLINPSFDQRSGQFQLPAVPPGSWTLVFRSQASEQEAYYAEQPITVAASDITGLQVLLQPLASIRVNVSGGENVNAPRAQVQLFSKESPARNSYGAVSREPTGSRDMMIYGVAPGKYSLAVQSFGSACVDSVSSGSTDLSRDDLIVTTGPQPPIAITLRQDCGSVTAAVSSEAASANAFVLLLSDAAFMEPKIAIVQKGGQAQFDGLPSGAYRIYAFTNIEGLEYANPEALSHFSGQQIALTPNQTANVTLELNVRGAR